VVRWYDEFEFHKIYHRINHFAVVELSAFYFDVLKDRLYTSAKHSVARRAAQTAVWRIGEALVRLLAPIMSFTTEEVWGYLPALPTRPVSVHIAAFPGTVDVLGEDVPLANSIQADDWAALRTVREDVLKALEESRKKELIGTGLEAKVTVKASEKMYSVLERYQDQLRYLFIVSAVEIEKDTAGNGSGPVSVQVSRAPGQKCERCWNYSTRVGEDAVYPTVCERCSAVLKELEAEAASKESKQ
jgi:isoleucyl-tRNA synthetase